MFGQTKEHLQEVKMSYWKHFWFALSMIPYLFFAMIFSIIHAIVPGLFSETTSAIIDELSFKLSKNKVADTVPGQKRWEDKEADTVPNKKSS